jgi:hypothetical protein
MVNNDSRQKVIDIADVEDYISDDWEYIDTIPGDRAIMLIPR